MRLISLSFLTYPGRLYAPHTHLFSHTQGGYMRHIPYPPGYIHPCYTLGIPTMVHPCYTP